MKRSRLRDLGRGVADVVTDHKSLVHLATPVYGDASLIKNDGIALGTGVIAVKYGSFILTVACLYTLVQ